jgi:hypothetical protein
MLNISHIKIKKPRELSKCGTGALLDEQQFCFEKGYKEGVAAARHAIREALKKEKIVDLEEIKLVARVNEQFGSADAAKKVLDAVELIEMIAY